MASESLAEKPILPALSITASISSKDMDMSVLQSMHEGTSHLASISTDMTTVSADGYLVYSMRFADDAVFWNYQTSTFLDRTIQEVLGVLSSQSRACNFRFVFFTLPSHELSKCMIRTYEDSDFL